MKFWPRVAQSLGSHLQLSGDKLVRAVISAEEIMPDGERPEEPGGRRHTPVASKLLTSARGPKPKGRGMTFSDNCRSEADFLLLAAPTFVAPTCIIIHFWVGRAGEVWGK